MSLTITDLGAATWKQTGYSFRSQRQTSGGGAGVNVSWLGATINDPNGYTYIGTGIPTLGSTVVLTGNGGFWSVNFKAIWSDPAAPNTARHFLIEVQNIAGVFLYQQSHTSIQPIWGITTATVGVSTTPELSGSIFGWFPANNPFQFTVQHDYGTTAPSNFDLTATFRPILFT